MRASSLSRDACKHDKSMCAVQQWRNEGAFQDGQVASASRQLSSGYDSAHER